MIVYKNEMYNVDKKLQSTLKYSPVNMQIDLTHTCNSNCLFCYQGSSELRKDQMETETIFDLLKELKSMGCYRVGFSGGEPFLRRDILEILLYASSLGLSLSLTSNGQLIKETDIAVLKKLSLSRITISLHAVEQDAYNFIFGTDKYNVSDVLQTIERMVDSNMRVGIAITLTKYNIDSIPKIIEKVLDMGINMSNITFNPLLPGKKNIEGYEPSQEQLKKFYSYWGTETARAQLRYAEKEDNDRTIVCSAGKYACQIRYNGDVYPCSMFDISAGNIKDKMFSEIWNESPIFKILRSINDDYFKSSCAACSTKDTCRMCLWANLFYNDNIFKPFKPTCEYSENLSKKIKHKK
jgi:AdoMet-dependent heme synthase